MVLFGVAWFFRDHLPLVAAIDRVADLRSWNNRVDRLYDSVFMASLGWIVLKEKLAWIKIVGTLLAFVGILVVVYDGNLRAVSLLSSGKPGDILILISATNWTIFSMLSRGGLKQYASTLMMFYVMFIGWLFTSILFFATQNVAEVGNLTSSGWLSIAFLAIF